MSQSVGWLIVIIIFLFGRYLHMLDEFCIVFYPRSSSVFPDLNSLLLAKVSVRVESLLGDPGPAVLPDQPPDLQPGQPLPLPVVVVEAQPVPPALGEHARVAGPDVAPLPLKQQGSACSIL